MMYERCGHRATWSHSVATWYDHMATFQRGAVADFAEDPHINRTLVPPANYRVLIIGDLIVSSSDLGCLSLYPNHWTGLE